MSEKPTALESIAQQAASAAAISGAITAAVYAAPPGLRVLWEPALRQAHEEEMARRSEEAHATAAGVSVEEWRLHTGGAR